jgi:hypothetical protein
VGIRNAYPSYHCTAWFPIVNNGSIPLHLAGIQIEGDPAVRCEAGTLKLDLDGDEEDDIEVCVSGLPAQGPVQIDPISWEEGGPFVIDLDIHLLQAAQQNETYEFTTKICLHQWNEEATFGECVEAYEG